MKHQCKLIKLRTEIPEPDPEGRTVNVGHPSSLSTLANTCHSPPGKVTRISRSLYSVLIMVMVIFRGRLVIPMEKKYGCIVSYYVKGQGRVDIPETINPWQVLDHHSFHVSSSEAIDKALKAKITQSVRQNSAWFQKISIPTQGGFLEIPRWRGISKTYF